MASMEENREKLKQYQEKLAEVEKLLEMDPTNGEILTLKKDLMEVIDLTADLVNISTETSEPAADEAAAGASDFQAGSTVEANYEGSQAWYPGVIDSTQPGPSGETLYKVTFLTFGNSESLLAEKLRPLQEPFDGHADPSKLKAGMNVQARYSVDRKIYTAKIDSMTPFGAKVTFSDYGNEEEVPFQWIKFFPKKSKKRKSAAEEEQLLEIPEHLKIVSTDTEAVKKRKQKRIKSIKSKNRFTKMAIAQRSKMNSWQSFQTKNKRKKTKGSLQNMRKVSIFKSPDTIDGKVGVTGSGKGMTNFHDRKKYRLNHG